MSKAIRSHKLGILKALAPEYKPSEVVVDYRNNITNPVNSVVDLKDKLRRWCMSEWCCTAIDYPWFPKNDFFAEYLNLGHESAKNEFVKCLNQVELGHGPKLTRVEWGVITSSFGKPRRFSKQFLQEEREKLSQYHESVGQQYPDLQSVVREGLPTDLAQPLAVGQGAIACHPKTRELQDGSVLTVDRNRCRVLQIDGSELKSGYEFVMGTNMQREVTHLRWKIMCEVSSSRVNIRDLPRYLLANDW
ncbi:protein ALWAYS EARLY 2-like [Lolium rigidum]|uniref:protein ALWAYS EARLY 2-like n=1 Tax=Lolium rigidum TaxID=89674 RepID=UPI001F5D19EE|nr:protein ALWAYS EARLY 2-like [Lolium rigidum]